MTSPISALESGEDAVCLTAEEHCFLLHLSNPLRRLLGPRPDWQGDLEGWPFMQSLLERGLIEGIELPEPYEGEVRHWEDGDRMQASDLPAIIGFKYEITDKGRAALKEKPNG